jgi:hypothetical protein
MHDWSVYRTLVRLLFAIPRVPVSISMGTVFESPHKA